MKFLVLLAKSEPATLLELWDRKQHKLHTEEFRFWNSVLFDCLSKPAPMFAQPRRFWSSVLFACKCNLVPTFGVLRRPHGRWLHFRGFRHSVPETAVYSVAERSVYVAVRSKLQLYWTVLLTTHVSFFFWLSTWDLYIFFLLSELLTG